MKMPSVKYRCVQNLIKAIAVPVAAWVPAVRNARKCWFYFKFCVKHNFCVTAVICTIFSVMLT
jgi:hypothetical protein